MHDAVSAPPRAACTADVSDYRKHAESVVLSMSYVALCVGLVGTAAAAPVGDRVTSIPGISAADFPKFPIYSGYLEVPGPIPCACSSAEPYDSLSIHYQLNTVQDATLTSAPVVAWHQGGPGGSSTQGGMIEMGFFQVDSNGTHTNPRHAWNNVANMLYLESPAGSGQSTGFSTCSRGGKIVDCCWDDKTQGVAYGHTLLAFLKNFPELATRDLYLAGESYFGQYGPNIAHTILDDATTFSKIRLKGLLVGNGCWGGDATSVDCNGPNSEQNDVELYHGKGLMSTKLYKEIYATCNFPIISEACGALLEQSSKEVGPHNVYDIYDNCPRTREYLAQQGNKTMRWLLQQLRDEMNHQTFPIEPDIDSADGRLLGGGYEWSCGDTYPPGAVSPWFARTDVQRALHLGRPGLSRFSYNTSGPASVTLYPSLVKAIRVLIYNGDADACVPYIGNEEWINDALVGPGLITEAEAWRPWFTTGTPDMPAGYVTTYDVKGGSSQMTFLTIRLAGHMVPMFQPEPALTFFQRFLEGKPQ